MKVIKTSISLPKEVLKFAQAKAEEESAAKHERSSVSQYIKNLILERMQERKAQRMSKAA